MIAVTRLRRAGQRIDPRVLDLVVAILLLAFMITGLAGREPIHGQRATDIGAYLLAFGINLPFVGHRRYPLIAVGVTLVSLLCYAALDYAVYPGLGVFVLLFGVTLHSPRRTSLIAFVACLVVFIVSLALQPSGVATTATWIATLLLTAVAWLAADNLRTRRQRWSALRERALRLETEREVEARRAVESERLRIARELHDVVAHSMSVIAVQSAVGHHVIDTNPEEARRALAAVETTSRAALVELRRMLGVLREDDDPGAAKLMPAPSLADLPRLVAGVREAGLAVDLDIQGAPANIPLGVDSSTYRLIQEALTNVLKHGGSNAMVTVRRTASDLSIEVVDDGGRSPEMNALTADGSGHGIIGMRERVAVFGGEFTAGQRPGGGYRVTARIPYAAGSA
jgi:signal transduction histidine kinase